MRGVGTSLLVQQLDGRLASTNSPRTSARVRLAYIPSADEALHVLGTFSFAYFTSHLFYAAGRHASAVADLLRLIEIIEDLQTEVQGTITSLHLATILL